MPSVFERFINARQPGQQVSLLNPLVDPEAAARQRQSAQNFMLGRAVAPFTAAPDIAGLLKAGAEGVPASLLQGSMNLAALQQDPNVSNLPQIPQGPSLFSGDPIRTAVGLDPKSGFGMLGEILDPSNALAKGVNTAAKTMKALANTPEGLDFGKGLLSMTLFHGTPHKFSKFSSEAIGTGEGAQAFGHGLYFAENPKVAKSYASNLAGSPTLPTRWVGTGDIAEKYKFNEEQIQNLAEFAKGTIDDGAQSTAKSGTPIGDMVRAIEEGKVTPGEPHLYEVEIPDEITNKMLDFDKPLSEQIEAFDILFPDTFLDEFVSPPPGVRPAGFGRNGRGTFAKYDKQLKDWTGEDVLEHLSVDPQKMVQGRGYSEAADVAARRAIESVGIPGIRYLDNVSRRTGEGTRNIVVFNADDITQVKRDGEKVYDKTKGLLSGKIDDVVGDVTGRAASDDLQSGAIVDLFDGKQFDELSSDKRGAFIDFINSQTFFRGEQGTRGLLESSARSRSHRFFTDTPSLAIRYVDGQTGNLVESGFQIENPLVLNGQGRSKGLLGTDSNIIRRAKQRGHDSVVLFEVDDAPNSLLGSGTPQTSTVVVGLSDDVIKNTEVRPFSKTKR